MNNYVYIISSLPALSQDWKGSDGFSAKEIIAEIKERLSAKDNEFTAVRIILTGRLADLPADVIRERLRNAYV